jgi:hypothetical protein
MNMDRAIFEMQLSVEATSLYILLCALIDQGAPPTLEEAIRRWTGTEDSMMAAVEELVKRCILNLSLPVPKDIHLHPTTRDRWC